MEDARILIVDDQPDFRAMLTVILQRSGFQVFVAADGEEALRLVSEIAPDLILIDVSMPGMDGMEAAHRIRQLTSAPILFLSALGGPETVARGRAAGGNGHLTKPFRPTELLLRIQEELNASGIRARPVNGIFY